MLNKVSNAGSFTALKSNVGENHTQELETHATQAPFSIIWDSPQVNREKTEEGERRNMEASMARAGGTTVAQT
jgi:hypothetical protein